jgi:hypothetical protein
MLERVSYADERLALLPRLREAAGQRPLPELLRLDVRSLRFHLGTSLADLRVPVAIDPPLAAVFEHAARDLFFLLCTRHRSGLRESEYDQLLLLDGFDPQAVRPASFSPPSTVAAENVRRTFLEAPELHPALDCGVVAGWIAQGRPGRTLASALSTVLRRAQEESEQSPGNEPTAYLVLLAMRSLCDQTMENLRRAPVGTQLARPLVGAVAAGLLLVLRLAAREAGLGADGKLETLQAESALLPLPWLAEGRQLFGSFLNAYGVPFTEPPPRLDARVQQLLSGAPLDLIARELHADLVGSKEALQRAERTAAMAALRTELLAALRLFEAGRAPSLALEGLSLQQLYGLPGALERVLATADRRKELAVRAKTTAASAAGPVDHARQRYETIATAARDWHEDRPAAWMRQGEALKLYLHAACALVVDLSIDRLLGGAARALGHRSGGESEDGLAAEHERGRVYLLSFGPRPILAAHASSRQMGHLFCDVKDFTKRTAFLKEAVVADFLQREFYTPILTAAAKHQHGAAHLGDKGGLYLNNLLGDAVSFSGDIESCVVLAGHIRDALDTYGRRLDGEANREVVARTVADIEARCRARRVLLEKSVASAEVALAKGTLDPESGEEPHSRLRVLRGELTRLEDEREAELSLITGEKLEAGIFISYGAAPEVSTWEDHVFGAIKVSIAEKINESARGTARNGGVKARIDSLLAHAQTAKDKVLPCPLQVFLSQPLSIPVPPDLEAQVRAAIDMGHLEGAESALHESVHAFVSRLARESALPAGGDIYNGGAALSEEALDAWLASRARFRTVVRRDLEVTGLHPEIQAAFVFPLQHLQLVLVAETETGQLTDLFVYSGRALFKGLEKRGGLGVWELVPRRSPFAVMLGRLHLPQWLAEDEEVA